CAIRTSRWLRIDASQLCSTWLLFLYIHTSSSPILYFIFFFFNDPAPTEIYTLSLHDALPISSHTTAPLRHPDAPCMRRTAPCRKDRKSTRLNSSHVSISYAVFCLKKKKKKKERHKKEKTPTHKLSTSQPSDIHRHSLTSFTHY